MVGLVDSEGKVIDHDTIKSSSYEEAGDLVLTIAYTILRLAKVNKVAIESIGVGCPNVNPFDSTLENAANLNFKKKVSLKELFAVYFPNIPTYFDNDANAAAKGEMVYGSAKGIKDFIYVTLGTGLGSGIVSNGQLVYGSRGMAGELGHIIVESGGRECGCGRKGCLEQYVAAGGIYRTYTELCRQENKEPLADNYREMAALASGNDPLALKTFELSGAVLGKSLANIACVTAPTHIFIFGGVAQVGEILLSPTRKHFHENLLFCYADAIKIELSGLMAANRYASILGAAALAQ